MVESTRQVLNDDDDDLDLDLDGVNIDDNIDTTVSKLIQYWTF